MFEIIVKKFIRTPFLPFITGLIIILLNSCSAEGGGSQSQNAGTDQSVLSTPVINISTYNDYSDSQIATIALHNNSILFSRDADSTFRVRFSDTKNKGIYLNMMMIMSSELANIPEAYVASDPDSGTQYYNTEFDSYLASIWDPSWWSFRLNMVPGLNESLDFILLDSMPMKQYEWLAQYSTLPPEIDSYSEWHDTVLSIISFLRQSLPSTVKLAINSVRANELAEGYDGFDAIGSGYADYGILEGFVSSVLDQPNLYLKQLQLVHRASVLQKKLFVISKVDITKDTARDRIDFLANYLLVAEPDFVFYIVTDQSEWAPFPPLLFPESEIDFGNPVDAVPSDIINGSIKETVYGRRWDSGYVALVNTGSTSQPVPSEYSDYNKLVLTGDPAIDVNGNFTAAIQLIPLEDGETIPSFQGLIIYP